MMWADQPAVREHANIAGASRGGTSAMSSTTADQNSTFVARTRSGLRRVQLGQRGALELLRHLEPRRSEIEAVPRSRRERGSSAR